MKAAFKKNVLFVGAFKSIDKNKYTGGQAFACQSLVNNEILQKKINWILIDTTADSNLKRSTISKFVPAATRLLKLLNILIFKKVDFVLLFSSSGFSLYEKGFMLLVARYFFHKKVIFAPRSGHIIDNINQSVFFRKYLQVVLKGSYRVICQAKMWKVYYSKWDATNDYKFIVLPNWVPTINYNSTTKKTGSVPQILFMGAVEKNKGINEIMIAIKKIMHLNFHLHIAGNGVMQNEVLTFIQENNLTHKVSYHGWVVGEEKNRLLGCADIFLLPSYREGYPNALLEAMQYKLACIATNTGSIPEIITPNKTGLLVEVANANQLQLAMEKYLSDETFRNKMAQNGQLKVIQNNQIENAIKTFLEEVFI